MGKTLMIAACVGLAGQSYAATHVVGSGQLYPFDTIQNAITFGGLVDGDVLQVENGYTDSNGFTLSQMNPANLTITALGTATITNSVIITTNYDGDDGTGTRTLIEGLSISNSAGAGVVLQNDVHNITIKNCSITNNLTNGVEVMGNSGIAFTDPVQHDGTTYPNNTYNTTISLEDCTITGNTNGAGVYVNFLSGIDIVDTVDAPDSLIDNNQSGVVGTLATIVNIDGGTISNNPDVGVQLDRKSTGQITNAYLFSNGGVLTGQVYIQYNRPWGCEPNPDGAPIPSIIASENVEPVVIDNNQIIADIPFSRGSVGIRLSDRSDAYSISGNTLTNVDEGIILNNRSFATFPATNGINGNTIVGRNASKAGVLINHQSSANLTGNDISGFNTSFTQPEGYPGAGVMGTNLDFVDPRYGNQGGYDQLNCVWADNYPVWSPADTVIVMSGNIIHANRDGIYGNNTGRFELSGAANDISGNLLNGIELERKSEMTIGPGNTISDNGNDGVSFVRLSTGTITDAIITGNTGNGLVVQNMKLPSLHPWNADPFFAGAVAAPVAVSGTVISNNVGYGVLAGTMAEPVIVNPDWNIELGIGYADIVSTTIQDNAMGGIAAGRSSIVNVSNSQIDNNLSPLGGTDIGVFSDMKSLVNLSNNTIEGFSQEGILIHRFDSTGQSDNNPAYTPATVSQIVGNLIQNNGWDGVGIGGSVGGGQSDALLVNNIIAANAGSGVHVSYKSPYAVSPSQNNAVKIINCTLADNDNDGLEVDHYASAWAINTILLNNGHNPQPGHGYGASVMYQSYLTVEDGIISSNAAGAYNAQLPPGNFHTAGGGYSTVDPNLDVTWHIQSTASSACDAGTALPVNGESVPTDDIDGDLRDALVDIGADEVVQADADSDGIPDATDNCPTTPNLDQLDTDTDGVGDACDNCTLISNADQLDTNSDGYGNRCDGDLNNDGNVSYLDLGLFKAAFGKTSADPNWVSSGYIHADFDGNGSVSYLDLGIFKSLFGQPVGPAGPLP